MTKVNFGRHKGKSVSELPLEYLQWGAENLSKDALKKCFKLELESRNQHISEETTTESSGSEGNIKHNEESVHKYVYKVYTLVYSDDDQTALIKHIQESEEIAFDTETTGLKHARDKVIGFSVSGKEGAAFYVPFYEWYEDELVEVGPNLDRAEEFLNMLIGKKLLMWNGSFDVRMIKANFGIDLTDSLYIEGQLIKHTLQEDSIFKLKDTGIELQDKIGLNVEEAANKEQLELYANIEKNGGSITKTNLEMYKADVEVLGEYASADADLTRRIVKYYEDKLSEEGLEKFFFEDEVMPLYREVTIPMEFNGVKIDTNLLLKSKEEIEKDIINIKEKVIKQLLELAQVQEWLKDTALEKHPPKKAGLYGQIVAKAFNLDLPKSEAGALKLGKKGVEKLPDSNVKRFLLGEEELENSEKFSIELWKEKNNGYINIFSKKQMGEICFDYMQLDAIAKTEKGANSFNAKFVEHLAEEGYEWAKDLHNYNRLIKIRGTYIDRFLNDHINGYYYFSYKQHGTISGRYGSDAQQLPRPMEEGQEDEVVLKYNNRIRKFFIADEDRVFIDCDYESLEPHIFAHTSGDPKLIEIFKKGHDFYSTIAIATEKLEGVSADKKAENYLGKVDKQKRQIAKAYALGVPYGMGDYALGKTLDIPTDEARELIESYLNSYPELKKWMDRSKKMAQTKGYVKSEAGRVRHLPRVKELYKKHKDALLDFKYRKKLERRFDKDDIKNAYLDYKNGINNSRNVQIQSMAGTVVNRAAIAINKRFKEEGIRAYCCAQVHDQLIVDAPKDKADYCKKVVQDLMENTTKLSLDLKAPPELAVNWCEGH